MSDTDIPTVDDYELFKLGVDPKSPMTSVRHRDRPIRVRHGDNLITRSSTGCMSVSIGYFTAQQIFARKAFGDLFSKHFNEVFNRG